jgi:hypothetical protein
MTFSLRRAWTSRSGLQSRLLVRRSVGDLTKDPGDVSAENKTFVLKMKPRWNYYDNPKLCARIEIWEIFIFLCCIPLRVTLTNNLFRQSNINYFSFLILLHYMFRSHWVIIRCYLLQLLCCNVTFYTHYRLRWRKRLFVNIRNYATAYILVPVCAKSTTIFSIYSPPPPIRAVRNFAYNLDNNP